MTTAQIPEWDGEQLTKYSQDPYYKAIFADGPSVHVASYVDYVLWECSTEFMATHGLPTDADVRLWITWLMERIDASTPEVQCAIRSCNEYIKA